MTGGTETPQTTEPVDHELPEFCSPTSIIYQREGPDGFSQIYMTNLGNIQETQLTLAPADHENPAVALAAGLVVFEVTDEAGYTQIGMVPAQGGQEQVLTSGPFDFTYPSISADGAHIHCVRWSGAGSATCLVNPSGGCVQLTDDELDRESPHTSPADAITTAAVFIRTDGIYRTADGQQDGGQSAGTSLLALEEALPNPAHGRVTVRWQIPTEGLVSLKVYNTAGQLVNTLVNGRTKPGRYTTVWNGTDNKDKRLGAGVNFYSLETEGKRLSQKVVLTK